MKSIAVLSLCCIVGVMSYGYAPAPTYNSQPMAVLTQTKNSNMGQYNNYGSSGTSAPVGQIVRLHHEIRENVNNNVNFETTNGIRSVDNTQILPGTPNPENPREMWNRIAKSGFYAYTSPEGTPVEIHWTADGVNGFQAKGNAIPTPVPVPSF